MTKKSTRFIYKGVEVYDLESPEYNCYIPVMNCPVEMQIVDCWVCNEEGEIHPGLNVSPVPVFVENIGEAVAPSPFYD